jgi:hypothetical protein
MQKSPGALESRPASQPSLEAEGDIAGYFAIIDASPLGFQTTTTVVMKCKTGRVAAWLPEEAARLRVESWNAVH